MHNRSNISLFDDYLRGALSAQEIRAFEERLDEDDKFKNAFEEYKALSGELHAAAEYHEVENKLDTIHEDLYPRKKVFLLRPKVLYFTGLAASITLILTFSIPYITGEKKISAPQENEYHELSSIEAKEPVEEEEGGEEENDLTDINKTDQPTKRQVELCDTLIENIKKRPTGTCFMISDNGYFLTSKHLVKNKNKFIIQQKETGQTFEAKTVYRDSLLDFAILKCHEKVAENFSAIPMRFSNKMLELGEVVFTLGYPKSDIVYTKGDVSSETGFRSDSNYMEVSMPSNPGFSGAPLFTEEGKLAGIITANNSKKQSVTYVLKHEYVMEKIDLISERDSLEIDFNRNHSIHSGKTSALIKELRSYIFELH